MPGVIDEPVIQSFRDINKNLLSRNRQSHEIKTTIIYAGRCHYVLRAVHSISTQSQNGFSTCAYHQVCV